jgi:hypothetical protein
MIKAILSPRSLGRSLLRPLLIRTTLPTGRLLLLSAFTVYLAPHLLTSAYADGASDTFTATNFINLDFTFSPDYEKELKSKLLKRGSKGGPMADLDGLIPGEVVAVISEILERHRKQEYAKYREEIKKKRHELWLAGDRAAYEEYANSVSYAKYEFHK